MSPRIILTLPIAPGLQGGGTVHFRRLALQLAEAGARLTVCTVMSTGRANFPRVRPSDSDRGKAHLSKLERAGIDIRCVEQHPLSWCLDGLAVRREVIRLCRSERPDAVLGWLAELAFLPNYLRKHGIFMGIIAAASYGQWWQGDDRRTGWLHWPLGIRMITRTARRADRVFANSAHTRSELVALLGVNPKKVCIVPPPLWGRVGQWPPDRPVRTVKRLIFFGRLTRDKGIFDLIEALGLLRDEPWALRVAGAGETAAVEAAIRDAGIGNRVTLLGHLDDERLAEQLQWAQLAVMPSYFESFGLSVVEAQLAGLPVIAYATGAVNEVIKPGITGWTAPRGDICALAESIREALHQPRETAQRGLAASKVASTHFLMEPAGARMLREIEKAKPIAGGPEKRDL